jgi:hypothetical protein
MNALRINEKIKKIMADEQVITTFETHDYSIQAEMRLSADWGIYMPVDNINYPGKLDPDGDTAPWNEMARLDRAIRDCSRLAERTIPTAHIKISEKRKNGYELRAQAKTEWIAETGAQFLADYKTVTKKRNLAAVRKKIAGLQAQQKALLPELRAANSAYVLARKNAKAEQAAKNAEALKSGRFWEADKDALKEYFHPPFEKNYLADVSEKWRAALFLECESSSYKTYSGNWGHKLVGTGYGYLCGIDDNGDEWGCAVSGLPQSRDEYSDAKLDTTVEEAMAEVFEINSRRLEKCTRQGDLLFCPVEIRKTPLTVCKNCGKPQRDHIEDISGKLSCDYFSGALGWEPGETLPPPALNPAGTWTPREAHDISSKSLRHNERYFAADDEITITHTSHATVMLPAGEYRLYMSRMAADAD